jgi:uncharacterized protein (DUF697 family)
MKSGKLSNYSKRAMETSISTTHIINRYTLYGACAGLIPVPVVDIAAVAAVQFDMIKQLSKFYKVDFREFTGKAWIAAIGSAFIARSFASSVKSIPLVGGIFGGFAMAALAGAATYALGKVVEMHFERGGTPETFNLKAYRTDFQKFRTEGKIILKKHLKVEKPVKDPGPIQKTESETIEMKLQGLDQMYKEGNLTKEEYETTKARILAVV